VAAEQASMPEESWDLIIMGKDRVGYVHTLERQLQEEGRDVVHVQVTTVMTIKRFGQAIEMNLEYNSVESLEGQLIRIDNRVRGSMLDVRTSGEVVGDAMNLTIETLGKRTTQSIPWSDDVLGPGAEGRILKKEGIKPGQRRSFRTFMPDLNRIITNVLHGEEPEQVTLLDDQKLTLQRVRAQIEGVPELDKMKTYMWIDQQGEALKTHTEMLGGMTTYRTTREVAMAKPTTFSKDFGEATLIRVEKRIPRPYEATEVAYRIEIKEEDPSVVFPQDERQVLSKREDGSWLLTIRSMNPAQPPEVPAPEPGPEHLAANNYLQTDHPKVVAAAREAVGDASDPWEKARRIERWVFQHVTEKNFSVPFASAAEVAENRQGDCTEHGVLLAALARVAGIPSRVATGLVYADRLGSFGYHMWAELYIAGRWVPLDGTLGLGHASPTHIKLAHSSLDGADAQAATFLPVARVLDRLQIEVVNWKHPE
jgi:hypothetical protein